MSVQVSRHNSFFTIPKDKIKPTEIAGILGYQLDKIPFASTTSLSREKICLFLT
jgi:hypothetical protein